MLDQLLQLLETAPAGLAFGIVMLVLLLCGLGLPLPEEFPLLAAGYLAQQGEVSLKVAVACSLLAILAGDSALFLIGRKLGRRVFEVRIFKRFLTPHRMERVNSYFHRYGSRVVFVARFMAGVRATVFLAAGTLRMPLRRFLLLDGLAAVLSVPLVVGIAHHFGEEIDQGLRVIRKTGWTLALAALCLVLAITLLVAWLRWRRQAAREVTPTT